jgi:hypothetical protein
MSSVTANYPCLELPNRKDHTAVDLRKILFEPGL